MSKKKNKSDFKAKSMAEMQERRVLEVEISPKELKWFGINIGTKTGDVGKLFFFRQHLAKATTSRYKFTDTDNDPGKTWQLMDELTSRKSDKSSI